MKSQLIEKNTGSNANTTKPFFNQKTIQTKATDEKVLYPTLGVKPIIEGPSMIGVRVYYLGTNEEGLKIDFSGLETYETQIRADENFEYFIMNVSITNLNNKLYYEWMEKKGGELKRIPISNPESKKPDGIFNKSEHSIAIRFTQPM